MMPTITVAIPLHGSIPWMDNIEANIRALPEAVTEIIVSDQTCIDNAAEQLRVRLADDPRVTVRAAPIGLAWTDHYQELLGIAAGEFFMWMPHDDVFEPSWTTVMSEALVSHPGAWIAYGRMENVLADGVTPHAWQPDRRNPGLIAGWSALRMMLAGQMGLPMRGLVRRREILSSGLKLMPPTSYPAVDMLWVFTVALQAGIVFDDRSTTTKRFYPASTHAPWRSRVGDRETEVLRLLDIYGPGGLTGALMKGCTRVSWVMRILTTAYGTAWRRTKRLLAKVKRRVLRI